MSDTIPWVLKYSPKHIDEMILNDELKDIFKNMISTRKLSHLAIFGKPGIGKTTLAKLLGDELDCDVLFQPCSLDGSIDLVKSKIRDFCLIIPKNDYKIIILDEADQMSFAAQTAMRNLIVDSTDNCRFILTANYQDKVIDALKSRCTPIKLEFSNKDVLKHCIEILKKENIAFDKEDIMAFYENVIVKKYPDVRTIIEHLQMMSVSGKLKLLKSTDEFVEDEVLQFVINNIQKAKIKELREYLISNEDKFSSDYVALAQKLFNAYDTSANAMAVIADALWRMSFQLDKEIQFIGMLINLKEALKNGDN